ncbi:MAG: Serine/threonine-protein kinase PknD [Chlamydiae bacterium]|nr:Serine/threonine-protein kinase PknD [Chlamydiota bacterium]
MEKGEESSSSFETFPSFVQGHIPEEEEIQYTIGPYQVLQSIGKGGMGEVLLAYDTKCGRRVALKKIRADLLEHPQLHNRFLKEARITSQLTHPSIIPIYVIQDEEKIAYYTMPFVQGETLKQILRQTREQDKKGEKLHHIGGSIPALIRIYIKVCQAIAYAHTKEVLHRDLKPENIMIGEYGEVLILDWGLAKLISSPESDEEKTKSPETSHHHELTRLGRVVGTVNYMAPERALGNPATIQTEIYSLGVILYQILTLRNPFQRGTLEEFLKKMDKETVEDPIEVAPYRDVPRLFSRIAFKCLAKDPSYRYNTVDELLRELENYIEGRSEWFQVAELDIHRKEDWEFQENVLIAEHIAITRGTEVSDWVSMMISKASYTENTKIETTVQIGEKGHGVGFLLSIPEAAERVHINDGYCLWLGSDINKSTKLIRSTVEVIHTPEIYLQRGTSYKVRIEKIEHNIYFFLNDVLQFSYISHLPLVGTHVGILSRDADFTLKEFFVYVGSQNITVNCLAVPDAFLAHKDYTTALNEYRRIGYSFPGRAEGREAMFRAGITILEQTRGCKDPKEKEELYTAALEEFGLLHATPGAPLQYLGKAHVYRAMDDIDEEIKCYELGFRRYPKHPLLPVLHEQLIYRMHETSRFHRKATYQFMLTAVKHLPETMASTYTKKLFNSLQNHWEPLYFIDEEPECKTSEKVKNQNFGIQLAFWLANPLAIGEYIDDLLEEKEFKPTLITNAFFCLIELGAWKFAKEKLQELQPEQRELKAFELIHLAITCHEKSPAEATEAFFHKKYSQMDKGALRLLFHILEMALNKGEAALVHEVISNLEKHKIADEVKQRFDCYRIWAFLLEKNWDDAGTLLHHYPLTTLTAESSLLYILYGCWLAVTENREIADIHFSGVLDVTFPRTWTLLSHYLQGKIQEGGKWEQRAFLWEKRQLYRQLALFYQCIGNTEEADRFRDLEQQEYIFTAE